MPQRGRRPFYAAREINGNPLSRAKRSSLVKMGNPD
jgi:hypothetical protein